jgi:two-component system sensor histidine kinase PilS (NtrC family)
LQEQSVIEQRGRFVLMLFARVAVITALLASTLFVDIRSIKEGFTNSQIVLYLVVAVVYLMTIGYFIWLKAALGRFNIHIQIQIVFDVLVATILVYLSGGVESPFSFFYAIPVINTAVFYPRGGTFVTAGLACLCLGALFVLENQGILPVNLDGRVEPFPTTGRVVYLLVLNFSVFLSIAWLAGYLSSQLRKTGQDLIRTESDLESLAALNRDIVQSLRSGLLVVDTQGCISLLNPVAEEILGLVHDQVLGRDVVSVLPNLGRLLPLDAISEAYQKYNRLEVDYQRRQDGRSIPIGLTLSRLQNPFHQAAGILVHMQDLTEQKKMEASVKRAERMAARGEMAAGMAHEIRNPLASISGAVQILKSSPGIEDEDKRLMSIILREARRLDGLLTDFLAYARPVELQPRETDLSGLIEETVSVFLQGDDFGQLEVETKLTPVKASIDPDRIRQVLWNLLVNAGQALGGKGKIEVGLRIDRVTGQDRVVVLEVCDNGPGVPEDLREQIFEPFYTTREQGSGLGLATVSQIVEAMDGLIALDCPSRGGSCFTIRILGVI